MYRIFCESYKNFVNSFNDDNSRLNVAKPLELLTDINMYKKEKNKQSDLYKQLCDLLCYLEQNISDYPKLKAFMWTISSRGFNIEHYNIASTQDLKEQIKLVNSFLKLAYWY